MQISVTRSDVLVFREFLRVHNECAGATAPHEMIVRKTAKLIADKLREGARFQTAFEPIQFGEKNGNVY